jgi:molybdopterin-guanine dinucleotide biosynthesis protein A
VAASKKKKEHRMKYTVPAVIFSGGKSSRMGEDKSLLPFAGYGSLAQYQYERLLKLFETVYLSAKEEKFSFAAPVILDKDTGSSPLVGLVSAFETLPAEALFILSVDAPFVDETVIARLVTATAEADAVIAHTPQGTQPLCGLYRRSILPLAKAHLDQGMHRMNHLLRQARTTYVSFEEEAPFLNLNHPSEYEEALQRLTSP